MFKWLYIHCASKNDTEVAHYNFNAHHPIFVIFGQMLLRVYTIERWFVIPFLLTNISALHGETLTPEIVFFFSHTMSQKLHCFGLLCLWQSPTNFNTVFAVNSYEVWAIINLFNFSCPFATALICCKTMNLRRQKWLRPIFDVTSCLSICW